MTQDTGEPRKKPWILVVEDDASLSKAYQSKFAHEGIRAEFAQDGEEGIKKLDGPDLPAVILLDLMMPKRNGFEVLEQIKHDETLKKIPVIILTNLGQDTDARRGKTLGAEEYMIKSETKIEDIVIRVRHYINE